MTKKGQAKSTGKSTCPFFRDFSLSLFCYLFLSLCIHLAWMAPSLRTSFFPKKGEKLWVVERLKGETPSARQKRHKGAHSHVPGLLGTLDRIAKQNPKPPYPMIARKLGLEGTATLDVYVSASGTIKNIIFKKSSGHAMLDRAIMRTVKKWKVPHHRNQPFWLTLPPFEFRLSQKSN